MERRDLLKLGAGIVLAVPPGRAAARACDPVDSSQAVEPRYRDTVMIRMRDGVHVAASIWLPPGDGPFPVILMRSLDRRRYTKNYRGWEKLVAAGYGFVSSDVRGRFESEGEFDPTYGDQDGRDGFDTIAWIREQSWSNGRIGTYGLSHQSAYQYSTAKQQPPGLMAMATWTGGFRAGVRDGIAPPVSGGAFNFGTTLVWLPNEAGSALDRLEANGEDVSEARRMLARMRTHPEETYEHLPLREAPVSQFAGVRELFTYRLERRSEPGTAEGKPVDFIGTPVFHECGWFDHAGWDQFDAFDRLRTDAATERARTGQHMIAGPWRHTMDFADRLGDFYYGSAATNAGSGIDDLQVRFFDKYVKEENLALPAVRYYMMGANEWRTADTWPPPGLIPTPLYLGANESLSPLPSVEVGKDRFDYDPGNPVPTLGGPMTWALVTPGMMAGSIEQTPVESRPDVLVYTTAPFDEDMEISGPVLVTLYVSTSAVDTDFTAKLTQVLPDGRSYNLVNGIFRMSGRVFDGSRTPAIAGEICEIRFALGQTSLLLKKSHRLRLQVSSSDFPQFDRNMNTGASVGVDSEGIIASQTIYRGGEFPSHVVIPLKTFA